MEYILSLYTHYFHTNDGECMVYNSEQNSFFKVPEEVYDYLESLHQGEERLIPYDIREFLLQNKIIIPPTQKYAYYNKAKLLDSLRRFHSDKLILHLIPTTCCNFSCAYCFEGDKNNRLMSDAVIDDLMAFINRYHTYKRISLVWYGGEPLLAFGKIKSILSRLKSDVQIPLIHHSIITNGYLFTKEICNFFQEYPLDDVQITLDGEEKEHNAKRYSKTDHNTYQKILENIDMILNEMPNTHVTIRINIDESNKASFAKLYKEFQQRWEGKNYSCYPGFIRIENKELTQMITPSIIGDSKRNFYASLEQSDLNIKHYPRHRPKSCCATKINSYIIGPEGEIYKCWNDVNHPDRIIGYINQQKLINENLLASYMIDGSIFEEQMCKDCFFFPTCDGGCPQYRLRNKQNCGHYELCMLANDKKSNKSYLNECLLKHYEQMQHNNKDTFPTMLQGNSCNE